VNTAVSVMILGLLAGITCTLVVVRPGRMPRGEAISSSAPSPAKELTGSPAMHVQPLVSETLSLEQQWQRALANPDIAGRADVLAKILLGLRSAAPHSASRLVLALEPVDRIHVASSAIRLAAGQSSDLAVREGIMLCDEDPAYALEYGRALIASLEATGDRPAALAFVLAQDAVDGWLGENAHKWITAIFTSWAKSAPADAMRAARESLGPNYRDEALQIIAAVSDVRP